MVDLKSILHHFRVSLEAVEKFMSARENSTFYSTKKQFNLNKFPARCRWLSKKLLATAHLAIIASSCTLHNRRTHKAVRACC